MAPALIYVTLFVSLLSLSVIAGVIFFQLFLCASSILCGYLHPHASFLPHTFRHNTSFGMNLESPYVQQSHNHTSPPSPRMLFIFDFSTLPSFENLLLKSRRSSSRSIVLRTSESVARFIEAIFPLTPTPATDVFPLWKKVVAPPAVVLSPPPLEGCDDREVIKSS